MRDAIERPRGAAEYVPDRVVSPIITRASTSDTQTPRMRHGFSSKYTAALCIDTFADEYRYCLNIVPTVLNIDSVRRRFHKRQKKELV